MKALHRVGIAVLIVTWLAIVIACTIVFLGGQF